jgi:MoxR-like ATPase
LNRIIDRTTRSENPQAKQVMDSAEIVQWQALVREVLVASAVQDYAVRMVLATHPAGEHSLPDAAKFVRAGASPRGAQALILAAKVRALLDGRYNVSFEDVKAVAPAALRHRVLLNFEAQAENVSTDAVVAAVLAGVGEKGETR